MKSDNDRLRDITRLLAIGVLITALGLGYICFKLSGTFQIGITVEQRAI